MAHILLGVTGSIAAFKACHLASDWTKAGHEVRVVMTAAGAQFVTPLTFNALTHHPVRTAMFGHGPAAGSDAAGTSGISHIEDAKWADVLVVAPASADVIARIANGIADDELTSTVLAYEGPKMLCPAMNTHMYANPATQRNLAICKSDGWTVVEPESGVLACEDVGKGRMEEPAVIERAVAALLRAHADPSTLPLRGLNVLVTAGPTQESLDPVRYLTNHSTGKMGYAIAEAARDMGADVTLVSGPVALDAPDGVDTVRVTSAKDMFDAVSKRFGDADITVMAAAVGDFRAENVHPQKIKKHGRDTLELKLVSNPDILAWAGAHKREGVRLGDGTEEPRPQVLCGFAMETEHLVERASEKLNEKRCDMLVANNLNDRGAGFATDTNVVTVLTPGAAPEPLSIMGKGDLAGLILKRLAVIHANKLAEQPMFDVDFVREA
ncbi:bifunctional phosphopantothenoylcysteine decarboxylase/phosphopantothenate--cysteine ligase CoaBC [Bifidobacterium avesanii]|uniref:Coenzyme A biosynthesis bifunctional protein CoaBC n=1 Tax=Bifidobacterium avesanii TaxID=1798157 RepID=A0A7K3TFY2_9BIFI|nr:bifunctional phosphopantothenoylcysteine decarboxylase/phosphopantothenate--cysteine ligase CoaBC [Bifidobacterium avesanii]KAB8290593.1 phosphopantothenoylcysteine decarboxylase [Bifidobacterium avesanii]NEG77962.1 bifunctional phosphopantothenoylcysteine decarboxylase/phosphopantothenate--cysteine ligase CoaBC [Bifidobacterium avesanii]